MNTECIFKANEQVGVFRISERLGRGGFKTVYSALNTEFGKNPFPAEAAICVPHEQDEEARRLLENEYRVVNGLNHPAIVKVFGIMEVKGCLFTIMEKVEGVTLDITLKQRGPFSLEQAAPIIRQAAEALDYAHEVLAIHRDIKPSNIIQCQDGHVKILDFGLARLMSHSQYKATTRVGSVAYMSPEQFEGAAGLNADLWSLGVTLFQLLTNTFPFIAADEAYLVKQILYDEPDFSPIENAGLDSRLIGVMRKILEKDPEKRYVRAQDFAADLEAVVRHSLAVNQAENEIEVLLRAHFPLVFIQTHEESRALKSLEAVRQVMSGTRETGLYVWSETLGLRDRKTGTLLSATPTGDPIAALQQVVHSDKEGIYAFLDIHPHLTPVVIRLVRDAVWTVKRARKSLVFISPIASLPPELEPEATLIHYGLPNMDELRKLISELEQDPEHAAPEAMDGVLREELARAVIGLTYREAERTLRRSMIRQGGLSRNCMAEILNQKQQMVKRSGILEFCRRGTGFSQVGGLESLKRWFNQRRQAFTLQGKRFGLKTPKGVVLAGIPGCGKSLSAKALADEWDAPLLRLDLGKIHSPLLGSSEAKLRLAFYTAETVSPCILWIDEMEKAFGGTGQSLDGGVSQRLFGAFLTWLEDRTAPVFVAATANDISRLPVEFTRKGRFDEIFFVGLPRAAERKEIFKVHLRKRNRDSQRFDLEQLADISRGCTGAEIEEAVISGLYSAFEDNERELTMEDIAAGVKALIPLSQSRAAELAKLQQWAAANAKPAQ